MVTGSSRSPACAVPPSRLGATPHLDGTTGFLVWAPGARRVEVALVDPDRRIPLEQAGEGYHGGLVVGCPPGTRYRYVLDDGRPLADPASRHQPDGVLGPSAVVDLAAHRWGDAAFVSRPLAEHVFSECHVGALTRRGTFDAAEGALDELVAVGVSAVQIMPVCQFPGARNWGYDGVFPYSVQSTYGGPAGLQRFVDACHGRGLAVVLDVVFNHLGPVGNVLAAFGPYFNERYRTPWGPALNFDGRGSDHVRAYFLGTVRQWFVDYHLDGLRLDAIHSIVDPTAVPFVAELSQLAGELTESLGRRCLLIAESSANDPRVVTPRREGGLGMDAQWNDDFHHALQGVLTGERHGYYADFGRVEDIARAINDGFVLQGEYSKYRGRRHGAPSASVPPDRFVVFAQNHDHIGNRPLGQRLATLVPGDRQRLAAGLLLLAPGVPLLFMGEEYGETAPFPFFVDDTDPELASAVRRGRAAELRAFGFVEEPLDPAAEATFAAAVPDRALRHAPGHRELFELHRTLIALRRAHPALTASRRVDVEASVAGPALTVVRLHRSGAVAALFNLSEQTAPVPVPALSTGAAPPGTGRWHRLFDSAEPGVGGDGGLQPETSDPGAVLALGPWAFCAYRWATSGGAAS